VEPGPPWENRRIVSSQSAEPPDRGFLDSRELLKDVLAPSPRNRIIQAMAATCAERGYAETSVEEVVRRAGVPPTAFAENFADKESCSLAAIDLIVAESIGVASAAYSPDTSESESVMRGVMAILELWAARPSFAAMACIQPRQMPQRGYDPYGLGVEALSLIADRLQAYALAVPVSEVAARATLGGIATLIRRDVARGNSEHLPELLPDIIYGALAPFLRQEEVLRYTQLARELQHEGG
jgi:AcrR family transcriptional regulator